MRSTTWIPVVAIAAILIAFRVFCSALEIPNCSPIPALFLCSILFLRGRTAWLMPVAAWIISTPFASLLQPGSELIAPVVVAFLTLLAIGAMALPLRGKAGVPLTLSAAVGSAIFFHVVTGLAAWAADPIYPKTLAGIGQSLWTGPAGAALPSWAFLRNLAVTNLVFSGLFLLALRPVRFAVRQKAVETAGHA